MYVNVCLFPESLSSLDDFGNAKLIASAEHSALADLELLHHFFKGVIIILSFLSLLDVDSLLVGGSIVEELFDVAPSNDGLATKLLGFQILMPKIIVNGASTNTK